jgi:hypothetical protein
MKLQQLLEGKITIDVWSRVAHDYSSTIFNAGRELGSILMEQPMDLPSKINVFVPKFLATLQKLGTLYTVQE